MQLKKCGVWCYILQKHGHLRKMTKKLNFHRVSTNNWLLFKKSLIAHFDMHHFVLEMDFLVYLISTILTSLFQTELT